MFSLGSLKEKVMGMVKKFSGRKDFLEAVCAASALVAAADGNISNDEIKASIKAVQANAALSASFKSGEIEKCMDAMLKRAESGRVGRLSLYNEIDQIAADPEMSSVAYLAALDIAESDGKIEAAEQKVLSEIAKHLNVSESSLSAM